MEYIWVQHYAFDFENMIAYHSDRVGQPAYAIKLVIVNGVVTRVREQNFSSDRDINKQLQVAHKNWCDRVFETEVLT